MATLVDYVETERKMRRLRAASGGGNKSILTPKVPGQEVKTPGDGVPPGAPGAMSQQPPNPGAGPQPTAIPQPPQNIGPYPPAPNARVMPGQPAPRTPGVPSYPTGNEAVDQPKSAAPPKGTKGKGAVPGKSKGQQIADATENQDPVGPVNTPGGAAAQHVANHVQDPLGATHQMFQQLGQKQLEYEMEKENARRTLAPVKSVIDHVTNLHQLDPRMPMSPDEAMGYQDPNNPQQPGMPGQAMPGQPPVAGMTPPPGAVNGKNPALSGNIPGASPGRSAGPTESVRPPKAGVPKGADGADPGAPGKSNPKQAGKGKKISVSVEGGSYDPHGRRHGIQSMNSMIAGVDLNSMSMPMPIAHESTGRGSPPKVSGGLRTGLPGGRMVLSKDKKAVAACAKCGGFHAAGAACDMKARDFSQSRRKKLAKTGAAMPGGGYPIVNKEDLANAKQAIGRAKNRSATIKHINERAKALGAPGFGK